MPHPPVPAFWSDTCNKVAEKMLAETARYYTAISKVLDEKSGEHLATGSFCELSGMRFLITNDHVAKHVLKNTLAHQLYGTDAVARVLNPFVADPKPIDVSLSLISDKSWGHVPHKAEAIPSSRFAPGHSPVEGELLFIVGYSGSRSKQAFGTLFSPGTPYLTIQGALPSDPEVDPRLHFALPFNPELVASSDPKSRGLPDAHGFSGSLVWNTRFREAQSKNTPWSPDLAQVSGILWGTHSEGSVVATKVEHLNLVSLAKEAVRQATVR